MAYTARSLADGAIALVATDSEPQSIRDLIVAHITASGISLGEANEIAEKFFDRTAELIRRSHEKHVLNYTFKAFAYNSSNPDFLQGLFFIEPQDDEETCASKNRRSHLLEVRDALRALTPDQFEVLCTRIIESWSPTLCEQTAYRSDQGIDFYAKVPWLPPLLSGAVDLQVFSRFSIWIVGQAKHYLDSKVSTPDLRDLVGAVELAKSGAYSLVGDRYPELKMRLCDPVYYLFMTTGDLSKEAVELATRSGVIALDGFGVADLVAHMGIGFDSDGNFSSPGIVVSLEATETGSGSDPYDTGEEDEQTATEV